MSLIKCWHVTWSKKDENNIFFFDKACKNSHVEILQLNIPSGHNLSSRNIPKDGVMCIKASPGNLKLLIMTKKSGGKESTIKMKHTSFQKPKEVHRTNGELLEALCIKSIDQQQAVIASNKKVRFAAI